MKYLFKQSLATLLACTLLFPSVLGTTVLAAGGNGIEDDTEYIVAEYDMTYDLGTGELTDVSGNNNHLKLAGAVTDDDFSNGNWVFTGNKEKYAEIPEGLLNELEFTIDTKATVGETKDMFLWVLGTTEGSWPNPTDYLFLTLASSSGSANSMRAGYRLGYKNKGTEYIVGDKMVLDKDTYYDVRLVFDHGDMRLYVDGVLVDEHAVKYEQTYKDYSALLEGEDGRIGYLGRSVYNPDSGYIGKLESMVVYNRALDYTDEEQVQQAYDELTVNTDVIDGQEYVLASLSLPQAVRGASITWATSNADVISVDEIKNEGYDSTPPGKVTRPAQDTAVQLTATITKGDAEQKKVFNLLVKAATGLTEEDYEGYFFSYFSGESYSDGEQIFFAASENGVTWTDLNLNDPVITSSVGEKGIRDPHIIRSPEGDKFYMIATDLKIYGGSGWGAAQTAGSQCVLVWESTDLVNWSNVRRIKVNLDDAGCTWAPESYYDPVTDEYIVFFATKWDRDGSAGGYSRHVMYYVKTRDFYTFTEPEQYIEWYALDRNDDHKVGVIDTTIIYNGSDGYYYRYSKNEFNRVTDSNSSDYNIDGKCIRIERAKTLLSAEWELIESNQLYNQHQNREGPAIFKMNTKDTDGEDIWCLLLDNYGGVGYYPLYTTDLSSGEFYELDQSEYRMPTRARHGTVVNVTAEEYQRVMEQWDQSGYNDEEEQYEPVLAYDFETVTGEGRVVDTTGNGNDLILHGAATVKEENGSQVLQLDGTSGTYAEIPQGFFDGRDTFTIQMDVRTDMGNNYFFTFTVGDSDRRYVYLRARPDGTVWHSTLYYSDLEYKASGAGITRNSWETLTAVMDGNELRIYKTDKETGETTLLGSTRNNKARIGDMGTGLLAYLGKSFYSNDYYMNGAYDNIKVWNRALSPEELSGQVVVRDLSVAVPKTEYFEGEELDINGLEVTALYSDGTQAALEAYDEEAGEPGYVVDASQFSYEPGEYEIKVFYENANTRFVASASFVVTVHPVEAESLQVVPLKVQFGVGEEFTAQGLTVNASYNNGSVKPVGEADYTVDATQYNKEEPGGYEIRVSHTDKYGNTVNASYTVHVVEINAEEPQVLEVISVSPPTKTVYGLNEPFDASGMEVLASYSNGRSILLDAADYTMDATAFDSSAVNAYDIQVSYTEDCEVPDENGGTKTESITVGSSFTVFVVDDRALLSGLSLTWPDKQEYKVGEELDLNGLGVKAWYTDGTGHVLTTGEYQVDASSYHKDAAGLYPIAVSYTEEGITQSVAFYVTVTAPDVPDPGDGDKDGDKGDGSSSSSRPDGGSSGYTYRVTEGANSTYTGSATSGLRFVIDGPFNALKEVRVNGVALAAGTGYVAEEGSTIISLLPTYLKTLADGGYTLAVEYDNGTIVTIDFLVQKAGSGTSGSGGTAVASTGDASLPWAYAAFAMLAAALACGLAVLKKRKA